MSKEKRQGSAVLRALDKPGSEALERLRRGELSLDEFVDGKVDEQLAKLLHLVPEAQHEFLRRFVRQQIMTSPVLTEYLRLATGVDVLAAQVVATEPGKPTGAK